MKIILSVFIILSFNVTAQTTMKALLSGSEGKLIAMSGFVQHIKPHIPSTMPSGSSRKVMIPKAYILPRTMTLNEVVATYAATNVVELHDLATLIQNYKNGNFDNIVLDKSRGNAIFVDYQNGAYEEDYIVILFFSPSQQKWVINAHTMNEMPTLAKGIQFITY